MRAPRRLRDGEFAVDCDKVNALLARTPLHALSEERAADRMNISRSVFRRLTGRDGNPSGWCLVQEQNALNFARACQVELTDLAWTRELPDAPQFARANPHAQRVRWGPSDGVSTGIRIWRDGKKYEDFLPWPKLKTELDRKLLSQLFADPSGFGFQVFDHHGKPDWVLKLVRSDGTGFCYLWLGGDPGRGWQWDGLIRLGAEPAQVWQIYQRYSDGTYRRLASAFRRLEDVGWNGTV